MSTGSDREFTLFDTKQDSSNALEYLRKESLDIFNRLHSIAEDAAFVEQVHQVYPKFPLLPNLRCGAWYTDPLTAADSAAYFKSTDGHFSNWSFNLRRANLHLLPLIIDRRGIILVDSTRSGKRIPDALSKTVPIWCTVVNRAIARLSPENLADEWDLALYTPPGIVSSQEHHQIEERLNEWADALIGSSFTLPKLNRPLRPLWITPSTTTFPSLPLNSWDFLPVICISASKQTTQGTGRRSAGFSYIQGSGDDHELWSMGLTPNVFWRHKDDLLAASRSQLPHLISSVVCEGALTAQDRTPPSSIQIAGGRMLICAIPDLLDRNNTTSSVDHIDEASHRGIAYVLLSSQIPESENNDVLPGTASALRIRIPDGKKGQAQFLQTVLPLSMTHIRTHLLDGKRVCIACGTGQDVSVGVALCALQKFFDDEGRLDVTAATARRATKKSIRTRLEWIISSRAQANPSRTTLKRVNEFLLSESFRTSPAT